MGTSISGIRMETVPPKVPGTLRCLFIPASPQPWRAERRQHPPQSGGEEGTHCPEPTPCCLISRRSFHRPKYALGGKFQWTRDKVWGDWE